jgi:hypothetical protein
VSGTVFRDFNANGIRTTTAPDPIEPGLKDVTVNAYDAGGSYTATTDATGAYAITGGTGPYRVEFILPAFYYASNGSVSNTTTQFVAAGGTVDLGANYPSDYCQVNPDFVIPQFFNGGTNNSAVQTQSTLLKIPYSANTSNTGSLNTTINTVSKLGTVYGQAYQKSKKLLYSSAFLKRHTGLLDTNSDNMGDLGAIYVTDLTNNTVTQFIDLAALSVPLGSIANDATRGLTGLGDPSNDADAFGKIAKVGLGDMDISEDEKFLYVVNLFNKSLLKINIATKGIETFSIPSSTCANGESRPFGLGIRNGNVYVGTVCTGENNGSVADLSASVYAFNGSAFSTTPVISFPLNYTKGRPQSTNSLTNWLAWSDDETLVFGTYYEAGYPDYFSYPQPILSDIDFDVNGNMTLAFMDRLGHQAGNENYKPTGTSLNFGETAGDLLIAYLTSNNQWTIEGNGDRDGSGSYAATAAQMNNEGPSGGEFFNNDQYNGAHLETSQGATATLMGSNSILTNAYDPYGFFEGGVLKFSTDDGSDLARYSIFHSTSVDGTFAKANGLGDIEILCNAAPIEIGNRVFMDTDSDGIQDADEMGLDGIKVELWKAGAKVTDATTANGGQYIFTNLDAETNYEIKILGADIPSGKQLTQKDATSTGAADVADSDAALVGTDAVIAYKTGSAGQNNHTLDFGFKVAALCSMTMKSKVSGCYQNGGASKATVSVEVAWEGAQSGNITITLAGQTRTIIPGPYTTGGGSGTIVSPQVVAFEIDANGATGQAIEAFFGSDYASATCKATENIDAPAPCPPLICANGTDLGGTVFDDYNADGVKQAGETNGLLGITVTAIACDGTTYTTTTNTQGKYKLNIPPAKYPVRVEFSTIPTLYGQGTSNGADGRTTTQFVTAPECGVDLGILNSNDYCQTNPKLYMPRYINGDPSDPGSAGEAAIVGVNYDLTGGKTAVAIENLGAVWGLAYSKFDKHLYSAAFLRRHVGLMPAGLGGIFKTDVATNATALLVDVETIGVNLGTIGDNATRGVNVAKTQTSQDQEAFSKVGKVGMGDLDISEDGKTLYFVNLFEKKLHRLDIANPTSASGVIIPDPQCAGGTFRPWGLKIHKGYAFVGGICDAGTSSKSNLRAYVYKYDLNTNTFDNTPVFDFPLTYPKGFPWVVAPNLTGWYPWSDDQATTFVTPNAVQTNCCQGDYGDVLIYPQPILSDIEIDIDGSMVLGFADRFSFQTGSKNLAPDGSNGSQNQGFSSLVGGDILRAYASDGAYILENNAKAGPSLGNGANNNQGPGFGEFYNDDFYYAGGLTHAENANGGLVLKSGSGEVVYSAMDPENEVSASGGFRKVSNTTGLPTGSYTVYSGNISKGLFSKSGGLGDLELACSTPSYLQIGNYAWIDADKDGVQDACEAPLPSVKVSLYKDVAGTLTKVAETTTSANGEYYFSNKNVAGITWTGTGADTTLLPTQAYKVVFGETQYTSGKLTINGANYSLTQKDATANTGNDQNDSDAADMSISGTMYPSISVTTGVAGSVNHTLDAGFYCIEPSIPILTKTAPTCTATTANNDGKITFTSVTGADKYFINSGSTSTGTYATSSVLPASGTDIQTNIPNTGGTYTIRFFNGTNDCYKDTTIILALVNCTCTQATVPTPTATAGTCTGATPNDDAKVDFAGITNADKAEKFEGATYSGAAYSAATGTVTTGAVSFTGLKHNTQYTFRFWNAADACFVDVTITTPTKTCTPMCTQPTAGTNTPAAGTCTGATPNNDAKVDFVGITNADKAEKSEGATYTGAAYSAATGTVTGGAVSFMGLKHNTQYTFRIWNVADACFTDVTITTPNKTCATPCPSPNCGGGISLRKL